MMRKIIPFLTLLALLVIPVAVSAQDLLGPTYQGDSDLLLDDFTTQSGQESGDLVVLIGNIIEIVLTLLGVIVLVIIVYAGFLWMTAGGNEDQVKKAKQWMINAIIGLAIILASYAISSFVITNLTTATTAL